MAKVEQFHNCDAPLRAAACIYCGSPVFVQEHDVCVVTDGECLGIAHRTCHMADLEDELEIEDDEDDD